MLLMLVLAWLVVSDTKTSDACTANTTQLYSYYNRSVYHLVIEHTVSLQQARCLCQSVPESRLAILDQPPFLRVPDALASRWPDKTFWVDAYKVGSSNFSSGQAYTWANQCSLPVGTAGWNAQPASEDDAVALKYVNNNFYYFGTRQSNNSHHFPLCQALTPYTGFSDNPPTLEWVRLGVVGHLFGFSDVTATLDSAKASCRQQAGKVVLATLDYLYTEVAQHVLNHHANRTYWVDAAYMNNTWSWTQSFQWRGGAAVSADQLANASTVAAASGLVLHVNDGRVQLVPSLGQFSHRFLCQGFPSAGTHNLNQSPVSGLDLQLWVSLGTPPKLFFFSEAQNDFASARRACAAKSGNGSLVRLAVLDTLFDDVVQWLNETYSNRDFWVDATRPNGSTGLMYWSSGVAVKQSYWGTSTEPDSDDLVSRLTNSLSPGRVTLRGTAHYQTPNYYICESVPAESLDWKLVGSSPPVMFGFSRTPSWDYDSAKEACLRQAGDVVLGYLDTYFAVVTQIIKEEFPGQQFWVDAVLTNGTWVWGNGVNLPSPGVQWLPEEPNNGETVARIVNRSGQVALAGYPFEKTINFSFLCMGGPVRPQENPKFPPPCPGPATTTAESLTTTAENPATTAENPATTAENPATTAENPATTAENPATTAENPATTAENPPTTAENPTTTAENPPTTAENPPTTAENPATTAENPATTAEGPATTAENPATTPENPATTAENPATTAENPATTAENSATTAENPATTAENPATTAEGPTSTQANDMLQQLPGVNMTRQQLDQLLTEIRVKNRVDTKNLSATVRRYTSAPDSRPSAVAAGYVGITLLVLTTLLFVLPDVISGARFVLALLPKFKLKGRAKVDVEKTSQHCRKKPSAKAGRLKLCKEKT